MRDIVNKYGVSVKINGMCCCPFHGEKHPSMKIYKDSYHCFVCGKHGDIFTFIQEMDHCDFKTAFYLLGGEYGDNHKKSALAKYHAEKARIKRKKEEQMKLKRQFLVNVEIHAFRELAESVEEGSELWWDYMQGYYFAIDKDENLQGGEY